MKKCAIIVNRLSGNSGSVDVEGLKNLFGLKYQTKIIDIYEDTVVGDLSSYERVVVCGGDGTLHTVINCKLSSSAELIYIPYGTLNEIRHNAESGNARFAEVGKAGEKYFTYVCAAGIFTPLGYTVSTKTKKRWKRLAYLSRVLKEYRVHRISAQLDVNGETHKGEYALIMAIDSPQCMGFKFNKMFKPDDGMFHLLTVKAPKKSGFFGKIRLFFPLFRTFFIGFKKAYRSKTILFEPCTTVNVHLDAPVPFDMDGERVEMNDEFTIGIEKQDYDIQIISRNKLHRLQQEQKLARKGKKKK